MSEPIQVALIAGLFNVIAIIVARMLSSREHKDTRNQIEKLINGEKK